MNQTLEQKIAEAEANLAKLKDKSRKEETGQKIILGGMLINAAKSEVKIRDWLIKEVEKTVKREIDIKRLKPLLDELAKIEFINKNAEN